jgi:hypothetical protein
MLLSILNGCGLAADRDVRAYNGCIARHSEDPVVCEAARQAYETDPPSVAYDGREGTVADAGHAPGL